jgi:hypothetical protein
MNYCLLDITVNRMQGMKGMTRMNGMQRRKRNDMERCDYTNE